MTLFPVPDLDAEESPSYLCFASGTRWKIFAAAKSSCGASRFFLEMNSHGDVVLLWNSQRTSKTNPAKVFQYVPSSLIEFLVGKFYNGSSDLTSTDKYCNLEFVSEYTRDGSRFRGHWDCRSNGPWNDWAYFDWVDEGKVPAKILMFAMYTTWTSNASSADDDDDVHDDPDDSTRITAGDSTSICYEAIIG